MQTDKAIILRPVLHHYTRDTPSS